MSENKTDYQVFHKRKSAPTQNDGCEEDNNQGGCHQHFPHLKEYFGSVFFKQTVKPTSSSNSRWSESAYAMAPLGNKCETFYSLFEKKYLRPENHIITIILLVIWWPLQNNTKFRSQAVTGAVGSRGLLLIPKGFFSIVWTTKWSQHTQMEINEKCRTSQLTINTW